MGAKVCLSPQQSRFAYGPALRFVFAYRLFHFSYPCDSLQCQRAAERKRAERRFEFALLSQPRTIRQPPLVLWAVLQRAHCGHQRNLQKIRAQQRNQTLRRSGQQRGICLRQRTLRPLSAYVFQRRQRWPRAYQILSVLERHHGPRREFAQAEHERKSALLLPLSPQLDVFPLFYVEFCGTTKQHSRLGL